MANEVFHNHPNAEEHEVEAIQALEHRIKRMERTLERRLEQRLNQRFEELRTMLSALNLRADQNAGDGGQAQQVLPREPPVVQCVSRRIRYYEDSDEKSRVAYNRFAHQQGN
ncbi:hypothetical protein CRG98_031022 [Punica granatum]|uniref:Uncharacterized protein n=1 Tax=Punica granatum TaxID=22663 RepID=A0A2I0IXX2_PUNGR|nr:hypothetical protein CRG98_031022 [Punica granatum]